MLSVQMTVSSRRKARLVGEVTPRFNDGDPCHVGAGEAKLSAVGTAT